MVVCVCVRPRGFVCTNLAFCGLFASFAVFCIHVCLVETHGSRTLPAHPSKCPPGDRTGRFGRPGIAINLVADQKDAKCVDAITRCMPLTTLSPFLNPPFTTVPGSDQTPAHVTALAEICCRKRRPPGPALATSCFSCRPKLKYILTDHSSHNRIRCSPAAPDAIHVFKVC